LNSLERHKKKGKKEKKSKKSKSKPGRVSEITPDVVVLIDGEDIKTGTKRSRSETEG
jgi:hypothetical protein